MLIKVQELSNELKIKFIQIVNEYKSSPIHKTGLYEGIPDYHLLGSNVYGSWDEYKTKIKELSNETFNEYVSLKDGEIIGAFYYSTKEINGRIEGTDFWVYRVCENKDYTFGKDWHSIQKLYADSCHQITYSNLKGIDATNHIKKHGDKFNKRHGNDLVIDLECNDKTGVTRKSTIITKRGNL